MIDQRSDTTTAVVRPASNQQATDSQAQQAESSGPVTPMTDTPDGFKLYGNRVQQPYYIYDSDFIESRLLYCTDSCVVKGRVNVYFEQGVYGAGSTQWRISPQSLIISGPAYRFQVELWCGVSVAGNDYMCDDKSRDADGYEAFEVYEGSGNGRSNYSYSHGWGDQKQKKFPMVETRIGWPAYPQAKQAVTKFRGWDTKYYSTSPKAGIIGNAWLLAPATGTGG